MHNSSKEMQVKALENGTVIDHIPADKLFDVVAILRLDQIDNEVTIGNNLSSRLMGRKGIIKIADRYFAVKDLNKIALVAPDAHINIIRNYEVVEKSQVKVTDEIKGVVKCVNPKCISNHEPMEPRYRVTSRQPLVIRCCYCEHDINQDEIKIL